MLRTYGLDGEECHGVDIGAGQAYFVPAHPHHAHLVRNRGNVPVTFTAYYFNVPAGQPATLTGVEPPARCPTPRD